MLSYPPPTLSAGIRTSWLSTRTRWRPPHPKVYPVYDTKLYPVVRLHSWIHGEYWVTLSLHYFQVDFDPAWKYLLVSYLSQIDLWLYSHPHQKRKGSRFQSADRSVGLLCLQMTRLIRYLPMLFFFNPDHRSIANRCRRSMNRRIRPLPLSKQKNKSRRQDTENKTRLEKIISCTKKRNVFRKWCIYSRIPEVVSFGRRPVHELTILCISFRLFCYHRL